MVATGCPSARETAGVHLEGQLGGRTTRRVDQGRHGGDVVPLDIVGPADAGVVAGGKGAIDQVVDQFSQRLIVLQRIVDDFHIVADVAGASHRGPEKINPGEVLGFDAVDRFRHSTVG